MAQTLTLPSERLTPGDGSEAPMKLDLSVYVYGSTIQLVAAGVYAGQTTNFRTPGGGFALVFVVPE